jgi:uncharacterized membrane-anchored protein YitT (DUF2179 family)
MKKYIYETVGAIGGALVYAIAINIFIVPLGLYSGGTMGLCQLLRSLIIALTGHRFGSYDLAGIIYYIINIPILFLGLKYLHKKFMIKTMITVTAMSIFLSVIPTTFPLMGNDKLTSCIIGGIMSGAGIGYVLRMASTMGGMDIISLYLFQKKGISIGKVYLAVNVFIYGVCFFVYSPMTAIYSIIYAVLCSFTMDKIYSQNINMQVMIISNCDGRQMKAEILATLDRTLTWWNAKGFYSDEMKTIIYSIVSKHELPVLKNIVHKYDKDAFIVIQEGVTIDGNFIKHLN